MEKPMPLDQLHYDQHPPELYATLPFSPVVTFGPGSAQMILPAIPTRLWLDSKETGEELTGLCLLCNPMLRRSCDCENENFKFEQF